MVTALLSTNFAIDPLVNGWMLPVTVRPSTCEK
jgi:hypothetical protein